MEKNGFRYSAGEWGAEHITVVDKTLDWPVGIHMHSFFEIELVLSGSGEQNLNGTTYPIQEGMLLLLTPIDFHSINPDGMIRLINISFDAEMITPRLQHKFMSRRENMLFLLSREEIDSIMNMATLLQDECDMPDELSAEMRKHLICVILGLVSRKADSAKVGEDADSAIGVHDSVKYIFEHFREDITLGQVAAASGYTPNYFSTLFFRLTGRKYIDFLNGLRINYAKMLLATTRQSVIEIAKRSGFMSLSNFARVFRKETGTTPLSYRKNRSREGI